jgi:copper chaperone
MKTYAAISSLVVLLLVSSVSSLCGDKERLKLSVRGLHCASCVSMVKKTVRKLPGVESVKVDLEKGSVDVECDSAAVRRADITRAIQRMGYKVLDTVAVRSDVPPADESQNR